ncbi:MULTISPECIES: macro domain-containing protein [unclassified Paraburkholderia]|uniref:macro domain-containing protein n=1 Tax=unclassified Paraburkholderia TaxID=2615204 RepID=UPI002AB1C150|nr:MULTISPECIES: macro domain-containing protein [unclassified Paraburkholderia]
MNSIQDLWSGVRNHPWKLLANMFTTFSVIQTVILGVSLFVPGVTVSGWIPIVAVLVVSVGWELKKVWKPSRIDLQVANSGTTIEVVFGDLFAQHGILAIAVNDFFDSELGEPVSDKSVHGIFLKKRFGGHVGPFDKQVDAELAKVQSESAERAQWKTKRYPIGSTALLQVNQDRYIAFAFATTDPTTSKASADVTMMWTSLHDLWERVGIEAGGYSLSVGLGGALGLKLVDSTGQVRGNVRSWARSSSTRSCRPCRPPACPARPIVMNQRKGRSVNNQFEEKVKLYQERVTAFMAQARDWCQAHGLNSH